MPNVLYICYFGIREPLVQTQVLPYLRELVKIEGLRMSLVTFEPKSEAQELRNKTVASDLENELAAQGIDWHWLRYHKRPSVIATAWDTLRGIVFTWRFIARNRIDLLHGRVHLPTLMAAVARKFSRKKPKLLFDIRGFFPEEYTDAGIWPEGGWLYRMAKRIERWLIKEADGFVVLTEKAREILFPESLTTGADKSGRPVEVIPCCVDSARFMDKPSRDEARAALGVQDRFVVAYVGSFGGWYLTDEMMDFFAASREYDAKTFVLVLTQRNSQQIIELLRSRGFGSSDFLVETVKPARLADRLMAADLAVSFIKACYSKQSSSPTKVAEYLACGLPIIANRGVGDLDALIEKDGVGVLVDGFDKDAYRKVFAIDPDELREKCMAVAAREFDLESVAGERYRRIYGSLLRMRRG